METEFIIVNCVMKFYQDKDIIVVEFNLALGCNVLSRYENTTMMHQFDYFKGKIITTKYLIIIK